MFSLMNRLAVVLFLFPAVSFAEAEVYKYVDDKGVVHYTDKPFRGAEKADLPDLQTYDSGEAAVSTDTTEPDRGSESAVKAIRSPDVRLYSDLALASPQPDETYRTADAQVTATAATQSGLLFELGHRVIFYVDGQARPAEPGKMTIVFPAQGLGRGAHTLSAAIVDGNGQVLSQSSNINFHFMPPTALRPKK